MAISRVKEVENKEEAESVITSAKGTYAAVILKGRLESDNTSISDVDVKSDTNKALLPDSQITGSYYVWYWCPSVDGEYKLSGRSYERVNVPRYDSNGEEITYYVGDVIDISFDNGQVGAPRFVRYWGLANNNEGLEVVKSNVVGIKTGNFPTVLPDALNLYSNQVGTPAYNLYPYLCKALTGSMTPTDSQYSKYGGDSYFTPSAGPGSQASPDVISSRFTYSFLPFSSWYTHVSADEDELSGWNPYDHEIVTSIRTNASYQKHLEPYWRCTEVSNDMTNIENLFTYLLAVKSQGANRSQTEVQDILLFYTSSLSSAYKELIKGEESENDEGYVPYKEFADGPNSKVIVKVRKDWWEFWKGSTKSVTMKTLPILTSITPSTSDTKNIEYVKEAIRSYLTSMLNVALSQFVEPRADNYFDTLVYVSLYQYVRYFYYFSITITTSDLKTDPTNTTDIKNMLFSTNRQIYNKILRWAKEFHKPVEGDSDEVKALKEHSLSEIEGYEEVEEDYFVSTIEDEITNKTVKILNGIQSVYKVLDTIDKKYPVIEGWLNLFNDDTKISNAISRLKSIKDMIKAEGEENFEQKIADTGDSGGVVNPSGEIAWPVPYASASKSSVTSGFSGSKICNPTPNRQGHKGIDISVGGIFGQPIVAAISGTVSGVKDGMQDYNNVANSYGNMLIITNGSTSTLYGHCKNGSVYVKNGETVVKGQTVANVGSSGNSTGPHLHFEVRHGTSSNYYNRTPVDPAEYFWGTKANSSPGTGSLSGNAKIIAEVLKGKGLNNAAIAGVLGNIEKECSFNPASVNSLGYSGICQWGGGRKSSMISQVPDWKTNVRGQVEFMWSELNSTYSYVLSDLKNASNDINGVSDATASFLHKFEIPCVHDNRSSSASAPLYKSCTEYNDRFSKAKAHFNNLNK